VQLIYDMYPKAISIPIKEEDSWGENKNQYFLLEAACKSSRVSDDVILFLVKKYPEAIMKSFNGTLPSMSRVFDLPRYSGVGHASWAIIEALMPAQAWSLGLFGNLAEIDYSAEILHRAIDMIDIHGGPSQGDKLEISSSGLYQKESLFDKAKCLALQRLLAHPNRTPPLRVFHCSPSKWTHGGLCVILESLVACPSIEVASLTLRPRMIVDDDGEICDRALALLEELAISSIQTLSLTLEGPYLERIMKGYARAPNSPLKKLTIFKSDVPDVSVISPLLVSLRRPFVLDVQCSELDGDWGIDHELHSGVSMVFESTKITPTLMVKTMSLMTPTARPNQLLLEPYDEGGIADITKPLLDVFNQGYLQKLCVKGSPSQYSVDLAVTFLALRYDTTLHFLELDQPLDRNVQPSSTEAAVSPSCQAKMIVKASKQETSAGQPLLRAGPVRNLSYEELLAAVPDEVDLQSELLELLKANSCLTSVVLFDGKNKVDYSGFSKCSSDIRPTTYTRFKTIHNEELADRIIHYMRLNRHGRGRVRNIGATKASVLSVLGEARGKLGGSNEGLDYFNVLHEFLLDSAPILW
jgi:hypothetical protein